jgi:hypothetical protein
MNLPKVLHDALTFLGLLEAFTRISQSPKDSFETAKQQLSQFLSDADKRFKQMALTLHPDKGGTTEQMQELNAAMDIVRRLDVQPMRQYPVTVIRVYSSDWGTGSTTTSSTTGWW